MSKVIERWMIVAIVLYLISALVPYYFISHPTGMLSSVDIRTTWFAQQKLGMSISLHPDLSSAIINWTNFTFADYYKIYYSENLSSIINLSLDNLTDDIFIFSPIYNIVYTDNTAHLVQKRYYRVSYVTSQGIELLSFDNPVGKFTYYYTVPGSDTYGPLASNRISLFLDLDYTAESFLQEIPANRNPTISKLDKSNAAGEYWTTHVRGLNDGNNFPLQISKGYLVTVDAPYNHTVVGDVYNPPYTLQYRSQNSSIFGILASNWFGIFDITKNYTAESFLQEIPADRNPTIAKLNKTNESGESLVQCTLIGCNDFDMSVGEGYIITSDSDYDHTLCNNNTDCFGYVPGQPYIIP